MVTVTPLTKIPCAACTAPVGTGHTLCPMHVDDLGVLLRRIPAVLDDLDVTITRQARLAQQSDGARSTTRPLPFAIEAARAHHDLSIAAGRWAEAFGVQTYGAGIARSGAPRACARYLERLVPVIVRHPDSGALLRDLVALVDRAERCIDRPPELVYVGVCSVDGCDHDVYAHVDAAEVTCSKCHARHDVAQRRAIMLAAVEDQLATATEIARAVATYGGTDDHVEVSTIWKWKQRGRIIVRGVAARGEPRYRVGDILDVIRQGQRSKR
jgi:hypothetical protein